MRVIPRGELQGYVSDTDLRLLMELAGGKECLEVGAYLGRSSIHLLHACKSLVVIDFWEGFREGTWISEYSEPHIFSGFLANFLKHHEAFAGKRVEIIKDYSQNAEHGMHPERQFDLIFIDGDHSFYGLLDDVISWLPHLRVGGWFLIHDYEDFMWCNVTRIVDVLFNPVICAPSFYGVPKKEFAEGEVHDSLCAKCIDSDELKQSILLKALQWKASIPEEVRQKILSEHPTLSIDTHTADPQLKYGPNAANVS